MHFRMGDIAVKSCMAAHGLWSVLRRRKYLLLGVVSAAVFALLIYFFINIGFYLPLFESRLPVIDKAVLLWTMAVRMGTSFFTSIDGAMLFAVSLLQGVGFSMIVFTMRRNRKFDAGLVGKSGIAMVAAVLGLGCVPCGTSLIMPLVTLFFSSSAYAVANTASLIVLAIAFVLSIYSLYKLGYIAYTYTQLETIKEEQHDTSTTA